jgi:arylsulfatase A-like enzyme
MTGSSARCLRHSHLLAAASIVALAICSAQVQAQTATAGQPQSSIILPAPQQPFAGAIGRTPADSKPDFPKQVTAPQGAPNIILIMTDDVGFGASSTFGGPIPTPTFDQLAQQGLRYNQFHTTALCSPTRAALLTGRNHHTAATGVIMEQGTGYPGYNSLMPKSVGSVAEVLRQNGYGTSWFGKNHNVPDWQTSAAGPFDLWPTSLGFDYFYGFIGGDAHQWNTGAFEGTTPIEPQRERPNTHFDEIMADKAIEWIHQQKALAPDKPVFVYYTTGTAHAPHHAPKDWIARFKGQFDQGWDKVREETLERQKRLGVVPANTKLTPRHADIPAWDSLSADQKRLYARMMEVYGAALAHADYQIDRVLQAFDQIGQRDNTLVVFIQGDNGPSVEGSMQGTTNEVATAGNGVSEELPYLLSMIDKLGGPEGYNHYPVGWAHAMASPFQWAKQAASHFGGTRNGMVMSWPTRIGDRGAVRSQFHHVIDVVPTLLEAASITFPVALNGVPQKPIEGVSMAYSWGDAKAPSTRQTQYFELVANRAIYHDGWVAATTPGRPPWVTIGGTKTPPDQWPWELYNIKEDFSQANNLAQSNPGKLRELQDLWWAEAARYNVLPLDSTMAERLDPSIRPSLTRGRNVFTYYGHTLRTPEGAAPETKNRSFNIVAEVETPSSGPSQGIIATMGGRFAGWALMLIDGKPTFAYALSNQDRHKWKVSGADKLSPGKHTLRVDFKYDGGGAGKGATAVLSADGKQLGEVRIPQTVTRRFSLDETFDVGEDTGTPVIEDYASQMPFKFTGKLGKVTIELAPEGTIGRALQ